MLERWGRCSATSRAGETFWQAERALKIQRPLFQSGRWHVPGIEANEKRRWCRRNPSMALCDHTPAGNSAHWAWESCCARRHSYRTGSAYRRRDRSHGHYAGGSLLEPIPGDCGWVEGLDKVPGLA